MIPINVASREPIGQVGVPDMVENCRRRYRTHLRTRSIGSLGAARYGRAHIFGKASRLRRAQETQASGFDMGFAADDPVEGVAACPVPRCQEKPARRNLFLPVKVFEKRN